MNYDLAIVIDHSPSEAEAKALSSLGFTNIMVDQEKKLLMKTQEKPQAKTLVVQAMPTEEEVKELIKNEVTRVIYAPNIPKPGSIEPLKAAPDNVTQISEAKQQKANKIQVKKAQIWMERRKRLINKGVPKEQVDRVLAEEDWKNMPVAEKVARLEVTLTKVYQGLTRDILALRQNQGDVGAAFDINNRMVFKMMVKLGISPEDQKKISDEAHAEYIADEKARKEAEAAAHKKLQEDQEKVKAEAVEKEKIVEQTKEDGKNPEPAGAEIPAEATTFGG